MRRSVRLSAWLPVESQYKSGSLRKLPPAGACSVICMKCILDGGVRQLGELPRAPAWVVGMGKKPGWCCSHAIAAVVAARRRSCLCAWQPPRALGRIAMPLVLEVVLWSPRRVFSQEKCRCSSSPLLAIKAERLRTEQTRDLARPLHVTVVVGLSCPVATLARWIIKGVTSLPLKQRKSHHLLVQWDLYQRGLQYIELLLQYLAARNSPKHVFNEGKAYPQTAFPANGSVYPGS